MKWGVRVVNHSFCCVAFSDIIHPEGPWTCDHDFEDPYSYLFICPFFTNVEKTRIFLHVSVWTDEIYLDVIQTNASDTIWTVWMNFALAAIGLWKILCRLYLRKFNTENVFKVFFLKVFLMFINYFIYIWFLHGNNVIIHGTFPCECLLVYVGSIKVHVPFKQTQAHF